MWTFLRQTITDIATAITAAPNVAPCRPVTAGDAPPPFRMMSTELGPLTLTRALASAPPLRAVAGLAIAHRAIILVAHGPQTAVALEQQAVQISCGNLGHGLRAAGGRLQQHRTQQASLKQVPLAFHGSAKMPLLLMPTITYLPGSAGDIGPTKASPAFSLHGPSIGPPAPGCQADCSA